MALARAGRLVVTSAFSRDQVMRRHQIGSKPFSRLPCTLDDTLLSVEPARNGRHEYPLSEERVVLTVARMDSSEQYKGHDVVLRALPSVVARVPNLIYMIAGGGDDRCRLEALARELGVTHHVVFAGEISDSELSALYQRSEIFVLPARTVLDVSNPKGEGFGIVFLEAMAFGKPVIGPNRGAPVEIIRDGENGLLVDPEDPTSVANALVKLLNEPETARKMGQAGRKTVQTRYSYGMFRGELRRILAESSQGATRLQVSHSGENDDTTAATIISNLQRNSEVSDAKTIWQLLFLLWLIAVNVLYYLQFRDLLVSRVPRFLNLWR